MKKKNGYKSSLATGIGLLLIILSVSNNCTKVSENWIGGNDSLLAAPKGEIDSLIYVGFYPDFATVTVNTTVTWINNGTQVATVSSDDGLFHGVIQPNGSYSYTFKKAGTYSYHNEVVPSMKGIVNAKSPI